MKVEVPDISYWEENDSEKVKYVVTYLSHDIKELERKNELLNINVQDYKSRIDKAIEYIGLNEEDLKLYDIYDVNGIELFKILRGEDNE